MYQTTFTVDELQAAINTAILANQMHPDYPLSMPFGDESSFWQRENFPLIFRKIGKDENVALRIQEFHIGDGFEAGDNTMLCVLSVGYGDNIRYFKKVGFYDSWDNGNDDYQWDGAITEVVPKEVMKVEWSSK